MRQTKPTRRIVFALLVMAVLALSAKAGWRAASHGRSDASEEVDLAVNPATSLGTFEGFGGNYGFILGNGAAERTDRALRPPVARLRMHLDDLAPIVSGEAHSQWLRSLLAADRPWTELWENLEMAEDLQRRGARMTISTWRAPDALLDHEPRHDQNRVPRRHYDRFAGMIAAYLDYLRLSRGVEPEAFSFNEPDWGANVLFTPGEYRDALLAVSRALDRHNLSTRLMLGELANVRSGIDYLSAVLDTPELLRKAGGLSVHVWGRAAPEEFAAWRELATRLNLPLIIGEVGVDPNWREAPWRNPGYGLREVALYLEVLKHARPSMMLYWEYGDSYGLLPRDDRGTWRAGDRFAFQKHWTRLTPPGARMVEHSLSTDGLAAVVFASGEGDADWTLHVANPGAARSLRVAGLPPLRAPWRVVTSTASQPWRRRPPPVRGNPRLLLDLPAASLTTLTTLPVPERLLPVAR